MGMSLLSYQRCCILRLFHNDTRATSGEQVVGEGAFASVKRPDARPRTQGRRQDFESSPGPRKRPPPSELDEYTFMTVARGGTPSDNLRAFHEGWHALQPIIDISEASTLCD